MLHSNKPIIKHKVGLLNLAEELNNVSKACKIMGVSRDTFYRYQELVEEGGVEALVNCINAAQAEAQLDAAKRGGLEVKPLGEEFFKALRKKNSTQQ